MDKRQKLCKNDNKGKMVILHQNGRSHFLNPWWILSLKNRTLKFWWFWDSFEGVWKENMQEGHFCIILEKVNFWQFWLLRGILGITKYLCIFWRRLFLGIVADFQSFKMNLTTPKTDIIWPSKRVKQVAV